MKKVLIINGHPNKESFCKALVESYVKGAINKGDEIKELHLGELDFSPSFKGYSRGASLEKDLLQAQELIKWAEHLVFVYPTWWGTMPALLKGFIDRVFLPGFAFQYVENKPTPEKLLKGKTARLIVTMDSPGWYYSLVLGKPGHRAMKQGTLQFCGITPVKITTIGAVKGSSTEKRNSWLSKVENIAVQSG